MSENETEICLGRDAEVRCVNLERTCENLVYIGLGSSGGGILVGTVVIGASVIGSTTDHSTQTENQRMMLFASWCYLIISSRS